MSARRRAEAGGGGTAHGVGGRGGDFSDNRISRRHEPMGGCKSIVVLGVSGEPEIVVEEIAVTIVTGSASYVCGDGTFPSISGIQASDANIYSGKHYAAVVSKNRHVRPPLPMDQVAPPLFTRFVIYFLDPCAEIVVYYHTLLTINASSLTTLFVFEYSWCVLT